MKYKRIIVLLCGLLFFLTALTFYLNRVIFPQLIKKIAVQQIENTLKRKVEIGTIHFNWVKGIIIDKIKIYEKAPPQAVFAQADQVSFGFIFIPGFKHYKITIPFIHVSSPSVHLIRTAEDVWNFSDMLKAPSTAGGKSKKFPAFEIAWKGLTISDGKFLVDDISPGRQWSELFDNINLKLFLSYKGISYDFTADIPRKKGFVGATVDYQPITRNIHAQIHLKNIDTASYLSLINIPDIHLDNGMIKRIDLNIDYTQDKTSASLKGDLLAQNFSASLDDKHFNGQRIHLESLQLKLTDQKNITLATRMTVNNMALALGRNFAVSGSLKAEKLLLKLTGGILEISTTATASHGHLVLDGHKTIDADPQMELTLQVPLNALPKMTYQGSITFSDASIRGFPLVGSIDNAALDADFQTDTATINALSANILDTNVRMTGTVKNFKNPLLDINAQADELNLTKIKDLAPRIVDQYGLTFDGTSSVKVKFDGLALKPLAGNFTAVTWVKNASIASSKFHQKIKDITGIMEATPDSLKWRDFTATYMGKQYSLSGSLDNFKNPKIFTILNGADMRLKADLTKNGDLVTINHLTGKYLNAAFDTKGAVTLGAGHGPVLDVSTQVSVRLEDFIKALPARQKKNIMALNPSGMISLTASLKGTGRDWKNYTLNADITGPVISLMGYKLKDLKISAEQEEGKIKNLTLDGQLYGGTVHAVASVDLTAPGMPYDLALNIDNTDLHELKMDSPLKMEEINGKFYLTAIANGTVADFKNNLHAKGSMAIREGYLAEFDLFKGLLSILNEAMRLGQVMITDVEGNFTVDNQRINTDNLRLKGPTIVLLGQGWVNFDEYCDLTMTVDLSSGVVPPIAEDALRTLKIHIYDKITHPKFKRKISVPQVINTLLKDFLQ